MLLRIRLAGVDPPEIDAVTSYWPPTLFAVNFDEVARPFESVTSDSVVLPFANVPLAPEAGAVKVTATPGTAVPLLATRTIRGVGNAAPTFALCWEPLLTE